jgi:hypothetical protein
MRDPGPAGILKKKEKTMSTNNSVSRIISLALRGIAIAMAVAAVVIGVLKAAPAETTVVMLGIGLFAVALDALDQGKEA